jgi:hypothetical protein
VIDLSGARPYGAPSRSPATPWRRCSLLFAATALVAALLLAVASSVPISAYADGAPPGFTGGFGESACDACHFEADINVKPGQLTISGVPERFTPGERYVLSLTLSRPGMKMGGFQLASRITDGGAQAGTLAPGPGEEKRIKIESGTIQYANQRLDGTAAAEPDTAKWILVWTAPAATGAVTFHASANAADGDGAARGDYVYTATVQTQPR